MRIGGTTPTISEGKVGNLTFAEVRAYVDQAFGEDASWDVRQLTKYVCDGEGLDDVDRACVECVIADYLALTRVEGKPERHGLEVTPWFRDAETEQRMRRY